MEDERRDASSLPPSSRILFTTSRIYGHSIVTAPLCTRRWHTLDPPRFESVGAPLITEYSLEDRYYICHRSEVSKRGEDILFS